MSLNQYLFNNLIVYLFFTDYQSYIVIQLKFCIWVSVWWFLENVQASEYWIHVI